MVLVPGQKDEHIYRAGLAIGALLAIVIVLSCLLWATLERLDATQDELLRQRSVNWSLRLEEVRE